MADGIRAVLHWRVWIASQQRAIYHGSSLRQYILLCVSALLSHSSFYYSHNSATDGSSGATSKILFSSSRSILFTSMGCAYLHLTRSPSCFSSVGWDWSRMCMVILNLYNKVNFWFMRMAQHEPLFCHLLQECSRLASHGTNLHDLVHQLVSFFGISSTPTCTIDLPEYPHSCRFARR